ncbi:glycerophosphodiester phosphodiesterase [Aliiglaciecola sp. CAU 1673]|uniref:glycerophosphodiester phosphodiesterase n=1 Tax=Aliiglaciecola sp. CAU 1673 TaxID=3032595 RepID=UPI0023DB86B9|nr:glycerophosphodiester phosphodiesterase [Aliiglaciecola sp. CAU 1673]MDF2178941.1 glycerophosphodiester phosphodiesterase [Aliiglaciecola sp. CAU 1673]
MIKKLCFALILLFALLLGYFRLTASNAPQAPLFENYPGFLNIAHQGGYLLWPSNTLYAFRNAVDLGVDMLEMDVHQSKDGHLVLMHDADVSRTTNGKGLLKEMTLLQIKALDAGFNHLEALPGADKAFRGKGIQVPTLEEIFNAFPHMPMTIEIKQRQPSIAQPLCQLVRKHQMQDKLIIGSFHQEALDEFRQHCPAVATSMASSETSRFVILSKLGLSSLYSPKGAALQVPMHSGGIKVVSEKLLADAHAKGMKVHVWTINDPWDMQDLIRLGVDGIISDRPDYLVKISQGQ